MKKTDHWSHTSYERALDPERAAHLPTNTKGPGAPNAALHEAQPKSDEVQSGPSTNPLLEALGIDTSDQNGLADGVKVKDPLQVCYCAL